MQVHSYSPFQINPWSLDSISLRKWNAAFSGNNYYFSQISNYNGKKNLIVMLFHLEKHFSFVWKAWRKWFLWSLQSSLIRDWIEIWFYHLMTLGNIPDFCIILESAVILFSHNHPTQIAQTTKTTGCSHDREFEMREHLVACKCIPNCCHMVLSWKQEKKARASS